MPADGDDVVSDESAHERRRRSLSDVPPDRVQRRGAVHHDDRRVLDRSPSAPDAQCEALPYLSRAGLTMIAANTCGHHPFAYSLWSALCHRFGQPARRQAGGGVRRPCRRSWPVPANQSSPVDSPRLTPTNRWARAAWPGSARCTSRLKPCSAAPPRKRRCVSPHRC